MFNGTNTKVTSAEARRKVDMEAAYAKSFPEQAEKEKKLLEAGSKWDDKYFEFKGNKYATRTLIPAKGTANGKGVVFCHGYTDNLRWLQKEALLIYAENGFVVTGLEIEGHGFSDGKNGLVESVPNSLEYLSEFIKSQVKIFSEQNNFEVIVKDWFLHGESMGGMYAINISLRLSDIFKGMILIAPMCRIAKEAQPGPVTTKVLLFLAKFIGSWSITATDFDPYTVFKDKEVAKADISCPIKYLGNPRLITAKEMLFSTNELETKMGDITVPFLVIHGKKDIVTSWEASQELYNKAQKLTDSQKTLVTPDDCWHSVLGGEPAKDKKQYWKQVLEWINKSS